MCYFLYSECNVCRWPDIGRIPGVILCDTFKDHIATRESRKAFAGNEKSAHELAEWLWLGPYTFVRRDGPDHEIYMARNCIRWAPYAGQYLCKHCKKEHEQFKALLDLDLAADQNSSLQDAREPLAGTSRDGEIENIFEPNLFDVDFDWAQWAEPFSAVDGMQSVEPSSTWRNPNNHLD